MSNKFKIKNIWTPEVSREEYANTLKEWDNALSSLDDKITQNKNALSSLDDKITQNKNALSSLDGKITQNKIDIATLISDNGVVIQKSDVIVLQTDTISLTANKESFFRPAIGNIEELSRKQMLVLEIYLNGTLDNEVITYTSDNLYQPHYFPNTNFWIAYARVGPYIYLKTNTTGGYKLVFKRLRL